MNERISSHSQSRKFSTTLYKYIIPMMKQKILAHYAFYYISQITRLHKLLDLLDYPFFMANCSVLTFSVTLSSTHQILIYIRMLTLCEWKM